MKGFVQFYAAVTVFYTVWKHYILPACVNVGSMKVMESDVFPASTGGGPSVVMLDITHEKCPMTFVRTRLALDGLAPGSLLAVRLKGEEPRKNVSRSVSGLGHLIVSEQEETDGSIVLTIQKKGGPKTT